MDKIIRFTGIPFNEMPWPSEAPWQMAPDGDPYKALLPVKGNENYVKMLKSACACVMYCELNRYKP